MAGIEKVCEFSDEYIGPEMYEFKRNHIQIHPRCRKQFRGATHTLFIETVKPYFNTGLGGLTQFNPESKNHFDPPFESVFDYIDYVRYFYGWRLTKKFDFNLRVEDPHLAGRVDGNYWETTTDLPSLKRRLKRMLRCKELNIVDFTNLSNTRNASNTAKEISALSDQKTRAQEAERYLKTLLSYVEDAVERHSSDEAVNNTVRYGDAQWSVFVKELRSYNSNDQGALSGLEFKYLINREFPEQAEKIEWDELSSNP